MSATSGTLTCSLMAETALAASMSGMAMRTMSAPAACMARICLTVASTSQVLVEHMVCTLTGAPPPIATPPTRICRTESRLSVMS